MHTSELCQTTNRVKASDRRKLIELLNELECFSTLSDDPDRILDEDNEELDEHSLSVVDKILHIVDYAIGVRSGGFCFRSLETLRVAGFDHTELTLGRIYLHTRKGKFLIVKPF